MKDYQQVRDHSEQWKPVKGYEGYYAVSNRGNVVSLMFRNNICVKPKITFLSTNDNGHGYLTVCLRSMGERTPYYVHRLVAEAFLENPNNLPVVNHIDHNRQNNHVENLEWTSVAENIAWSREQMKKEKSICRSTNTGEKYISRYQDKKGNTKYRLQIKRLGVSRLFSTLEDAVSYKRVVMGK